MIFERGPHAFLGGTAQVLRQSIVDGWSMLHLSQFASAYISERIVILSNLRCAIATFLAEVRVMLLLVLVLYFIDNSY